MDEQKRILRVVIFRGLWHWVAQCLEVDIAAQAESREDLPERLRRAFEAEIVLSREQGIAPFSTLPPAPYKFFAMWGGSDGLPELQPWRDVHPLVAVSEPRAAIGRA